MDCTGSMGENVEGGHRAEDSVQALLDYLTSQGAVLRLGGIKFNGPDSGNGQDSINVSQFTSLASFTTVAAFKSSAWLYDGYSPNGGDAEELQLDALDSAAQDMVAHSTPGNPNRYIVLVTDSAFHDDEGGSTVTESQVTSELTGSGCKVYISLYDYDGSWIWPSSPEDTYAGLDINGGFDDMDYNTDLAHMYEFDKLKAEILGN